MYRLKIKKLNKKALSTTVSLVLTILISITLAVSFGLILTKALTSNLSPQLSCTELGITKPISISSICYNTNTEEIEIVVQREFDTQNIFNLKFNLDSQSSEKLNWQCNPLSCNSCSILKQGEQIKYYLSAPNLKLNSQNNLILSVNSCVLESKALEICN